MRHKFLHLLSLILAVTIILPTAVIGLSAAVESEDNNTLLKADKIEIGETVTGALDYEKDSDIFCFTVPSPGEISIDVSVYFRYYDFNLYDENGDKLFNLGSIQWNEVSGMSYKSFVFDLLPGIYYFSLSSRTKYTGDYSTKVSFTPANVTENENNNDIRSAQNIELNETMYAFMHFDSTPDNFVVTISKPGVYYIDVMCYAKNLSLYLLDQNGAKLWSITHHYSSPFRSYEFTLEAGTYYFSVENYSYDTDATAEGTGEYNFRIYPESKPEDEPTTPPDDTVDSSEIFNDVPATAWYKIYIDFSITINIFTGTSTTTFSPDMAMNRAMLVTVLWRLEGSPSVNCKLPFSDVPTNTWYSEAVEWAYLNGIVKGTSATTFSPNSNITREQIATILYRYASETKSLNLGERYNLYSFSDGYTTNDFAWDALSWATAVEIINGANYGNGIVLDPQGVATRAQVAKILTVFYNNYMI